MVLVIPCCPRNPGCEDILHANFFQARIPFPGFRKQLFPLFLAHCGSLFPVSLHDFGVTAPAQLVGQHRIQEMANDGGQQQENQDSCKQFFHSAASVSVPVTVICLPVRSPKHCSGQSANSARPRISPSETIL